MKERLRRRIPSYNERSINTYPIKTPRANTLIGNSNIISSNGCEEIAGKADRRSVAGIVGMEGTPTNKSVKPPFQTRQGIKCSLTILLYLAHLEEDEQDGRPYSLQRGKTLMDFMRSRSF